MPNGCPRTININISGGNISVNPPVIGVNRACQEIRATLTSDSTGRFAATPITFPWPVPSSVPLPSCGVWTEWPATGTITPGPGSNQLTIRPNKVLSPGGPAECYKFDVHWIKDEVDQTLDPTIENDPFPPSSPEDLPEQAKGDPPRGPRSDGR